MATIPIHNPTTPFLGQIPGGIRAGSTIRIKGMMHGYGTRFNFNLQVGPALSPRDDCALHMSIRPDQQCIVRNSLENGSYSTEERYGGCPVQYGQIFDIAILVDHGSYNITINGVQFCQFNHRLPLTRVQFIALGDGSTVHYIGHEMGGAPIHRPIAPTHSAPSYQPMPYPSHPPAYPPAGGVQVLPIPVAPPPPPYSPAPFYPNHQANQHATAYGFLPPEMQPQQAFVSQTNFAASNVSQHQAHQHKNQSFGTLGANFAAMKKTLHTKKKSNRKALGLAAGVGAGLGALGLGGYAISRAITNAANSGSDNDSE